MCVCVCRHICCQRTVALSGVCPLWGGGSVFVQGCRRFVFVRGIVVVLA